MPPCLEKLIPPAVAEPARWPDFPGGRLMIPLRKALLASEAIGAEGRQEPFICGISVSCGQDELLRSQSRLCLCPKWVWGRVFLCMQYTASNGTCTERLLQNALFNHGQVASKGLRLSDVKLREIDGFPHGSAWESPQRCDPTIRVLLLG